MRGNAEIPIMKGFESGFVVKANDGHESDTLPPDPGADVTDKTDSDFEEAGGTKPAANIKGGDNKPGAASTTMADDVSEVAAEAEKPIDDGYVEDIQGPKVSDGGEVDKGWASFNEKCAGGYIVKDYGMNKHNVHSAYADMQAAVDSEFVEKGPRQWAEAAWRGAKWGAGKAAEGGKKVGSGAKWGAGKAKEGAMAAGRGAKTGAGKAKEGAVYVGGKAKQGGQYVGGKAKAGGLYVGGKAKQGGKYVGGKAKEAGADIMANKKRYGAGLGAGAAIGAGATYAATRKKKS